MLKLACNLTPDLIIIIYQPVHWPWFIHLNASSQSENRPWLKNLRVSTRRRNGKSHSAVLVNTYYSGYSNVWTGYCKKHFNRIFVHSFLTLGPALLQLNQGEYRKRNVQNLSILDSTRPEMQRKCVWRLGSGGCILRLTSPGQTTLRVWIWPM